MSKKYDTRGNIGVAFTYNEPMIGYEFVRDSEEEMRELTEWVAELTDNSGKGKTGICFYRKLLNAIDFSGLINPVKNLIRI